MCVCMVSSPAESMRVRKMCVCTAVYLTQMYQLLLIYLFVSVSVPEPLVSVVSCMFLFQCEFESVLPYIYLCVIR